MVDPTKASSAGVVLDCRKAQMRKWIESGPKVPIPLVARGMVLCDKSDILVATWDKQELTSHIWKIDKENNVREVSIPPSLTEEEVTGLECNSNQIYFLTTMTIFVFEKDTLDIIHKIQRPMLERGVFDRNGKLFTDGIAVDSIRNHVYAMSCGRTSEIIQYDMHTMQINWTSLLRYATNLRGIWINPVNGNAYATFEQTLAEWFPVQNGMCTVTPVAMPDIIAMDIGSHGQVVAIDMNAIYMVDLEHKYVKTTIAGKSHWRKSENAGLTFLNLRYMKIDTLGAIIVVDHNTVRRLVFRGRRMYDVLIDSELHAMELAAIVVDWVVERKQQ